MATSAMPSGCSTSTSINSKIQTTAEAIRMPAEKFRNDVLFFYCSRKCLLAVKRANGRVRCENSPRQKKRNAERKPRLNRGARVHIERVKRCLSADVQSISHRSTEADIRHDLANRNRADMSAVRCVAEHSGAGGRPDIPGGVTTQAIEEAFRACGEGRRRAERNAVGCYGIGVDRYGEPRPMRRTGIDDIEEFLIGGECEAFLLILIPLLFLDVARSLIVAIVIRCAVL